MINSGTGKKFQELGEMLKAKQNALEALRDKYGFKNIYTMNESFGGGIHSVKGFIEEPDKKHWRKVEATSGYYPSKRTLKGREILKEFKAVPVVASRDINSCVGFDGEPFRTIGYNMMKPDSGYYGFQVGDDWRFTAPADCEEVTRSQYLEIFEK